MPETAVRQEASSVAAGAAQLSPAEHEQNFDVLNTSDVEREKREGLRLEQNEPVAALRPVQ
jgi:hypothetical protein